MGLRYLSDSPSRMPAPEDPNPRHFCVTHVEVIGAFTLAIINYPNCTTFGGNKICVYHGNVAPALMHATAIDPHFLHAGLSPVARFVADPFGLELARQFCVRCMA